MTAADAHTVDSLLSHPAVRAACAAWEEEGRCPVGFGDWLEENGLPGAGFARWAEEVEDREGVRPRVRGGISPVVYDGGWYWTIFREGEKVWRSDIPSEVFKKLPGHLGHPLGTVDYPSFAHAVCAVLLVWPEGYTP